MSRILVDSSRWPLVRVRLPPSATDEEVQQYLDELGELRARREPYGLIIIADESRGFTAKQRQMQADYIASGADLSRKYLKAFAFVAESAMQRGMLTAIFWLRAPEWPHRVFRTVEEASVWVRTLVEEGRSSTDLR
ncbi:MAG: hypothetical protein GX607_22690 [Myxococcales bacterium]|nr:hypothetical protein [Myxococcales bacterium]